MIDFLGGDHLLTISEREALIPALEPFRKEDHIWLATCNRVELYRGDGQCDISLARHLFRVVAGLESRLLGENHIQGQVKRAYMDAVEEGRVSGGLHRLFQAALRAGKRVRTETSISSGAVSHSHAAYVQLRELSPSLPLQKILVIGVNELTESFIRYCKRGKMCHITICNRTASHAKPLAEKYGLHQLDFESLGGHLTEYDAIVTATAAPTPFIIKEYYRSFSGTQIIFDLAVPRDVHPLVGSVDGVFLRTIDVVEALVDQSLVLRLTQVEQAESIIEEELSLYAESYLPFQKRSP